MLKVDNFALVERLAKYKESVCLFIRNFNVPFDNNQAERDICMIKVKMKVSGCFRTEEGARDCLKIMSYIGTAHKQGYNAYEAIRYIFIQKLLTVYILLYILDIWKEMILCK